MNIVIEYLVLFSTTMQTTMIYVIVSTCIWSYIVYHIAQAHITKQQWREQCWKKNPDLLSMLGDWQEQCHPPPDSHWPHVDDA